METNTKKYGIPDYGSLGLSNDFLFGKIMQDARLCKPFLETVLNIRIDHIVYIQNQKTIDEKIDSKSVRLDIYVDDGKVVYNCEMQTAKGGELPKRSRYYQGQIDINLIPKGGTYKSLKKSFVIFICTFDPFGQGQYIYTFENKCKECPELALEDGAVKVFLNTKGSQGKISRELKNLLEYIDGADVTAKSSLLVKDLDEAVKKARTNEEWRHDYMTLELLKNECREEGREEGRAEGRDEGRTEMIVGMLRGGIDVAVIANIAQMSVDDIHRIKKEHNI